MIRKATIAQLKPRVEKAVAKQINTMEALEGGLSNPQVKALYNVCQGRMDALKAVLDAINKDSFHLDILGE